MRKLGKQGSSIQHQLKRRLKIHFKRSIKTKKIEKLSYKEKRLLEILPEEIKSLEKDKKSLEKQLSGPTFYDQDKIKIQDAFNEFDRITAEIEDKIEIWGVITEKEESIKRNKKPPSR